MIILWKRHGRAALVGAAVCILVSGGAFSAQKKPNEDRDLPKVLIIGDSISLGYTPHVVKMMKNEDFICHNRTICWWC